MSRPHIPDALGQSEAFIAFQEALSTVAKVDRPVLIVGERGTGKELAVQRLHYLSARWQQPLVALNSSSLNPNVVESELFGHEAGAFTGATRRRSGRFEAAEGGTLFLDEIGLIPVEVQEKILRVTEYRQFERVGGSDPITVDVRLVGATNADLPRLASEGKFKRDLLDRLSFEVLFLPPLRARVEDILLLAQHFATRMSMELGRGGVVEFTDGAVEKLETYRWPGNIRELKNVVERALYKSVDTLIEAREIVFDPFQHPYAQALREMPLVGEGMKDAAGRMKEATGVQAPHEASETTLTSTPSNLPAATPQSFALGEDTLPAAVRRLELDALQQALKSARHRQGAAADLLGLTYHQFRGLYRKYQDEIETAS